MPNEEKKVKPTTEAAGRREFTLLCVDETSKCSCEIELVWSALATKCLRCGGDV